MFTSKTTSKASMFTAALLLSAGMIGCDKDEVVEQVEANNAVYPAASEHGIAELSPWCTHDYVPPKTIEELLTTGHINYLVGTIQEVQAIGSVMTNKMGTVVEECKFPIRIALRVSMTVQKASWDTAKDQKLDLIFHRNFFDATDAIPALNTHLQSPVVWTDGQHYLQKGDTLGLSVYESQEGDLYAVEGSLFQVDQDDLVYNAEIQSDCGQTYDYNGYQLSDLLEQARKGSGGTLNNTNPGLTDEQLSPQCEMWPEDYE